MPLYSSRLILPLPSMGTLTDHVIAADDQGVILSIQPLSAYPDQRHIQFLPGIKMYPALSMHCHLELSHMKGMIPTGTGLVEFIRQIVNEEMKPKAIFHRLFFLRIRKCMMKVS